MHSIKIGSYHVGSAFPPFVVAEISANHNQSLERALQLVASAKQQGAQAIKLQTYTPDTMTLNINEGEFTIEDPKSLWHHRSLYNLYQEAYTPWEWHAAIFQRCKELDLLAFSTPFDASAVQFLESFEVPCYKIASLELVDLPLIREAAKTKKPLILSTGAATFEEIAEAVQAAQSSGCKQIMLLKCTAAYPAPPSELHLKTIPHMMDAFKVPVGLSDHSPGIGAAIASVALGASLIEKHFTLSREEGGVDAPFSIEPHELKLLTTEAARAWQALGNINYGPTPHEISCLALRRSLYFVKNKKKGDKIEAADIRAIRPGKGLPPRELEKVIGRKLVKDVSIGEAVAWEQMAHGD